MGLTLAERRAVTETTAIRYSLADKRTKGIILDELCATTGWQALQPWPQGAHNGVAAQIGTTEKSAATEVRTGCHCRTNGVLGGAGNARR